MIDSDKSISIFKLLDEQFMRKQAGSDQALYDNMFEKLQPVTSSILYKPPNDRYTSKKFTIAHFAGDVTYTVTDFVEKNKDSQNEIITKTLSECKHPLVSQLYANKQSKGKSNLAGNTLSK